MSGREMPNEFDEKGCTVPGCPGVMVFRPNRPGVGAAVESAPLPGALRGPGWQCEEDWDYFEPWSSRTAALGMPHGLDNSRCPRPGAGFKGNT